MFELEQNNNLVAKIWWAFLWRAILYSLLGGVLSVWFIGFVGPAAGVPVEDIEDTGAFVGGLVGVLLSFHAMKVVLLKRFKGFRIALVKDEGTDPLFLRD